jgi:hypothetical protein
MESTDWSTLSSAPSIGFNSFADSSFKSLFSQEMGRIADPDLSSFQHPDYLSGVSGSQPMSAVTATSTVYASSSNVGGQDYLPNPSNVSESPESRGSPSEKSSTTKGSSANTKSSGDPSRIEKRKQNTLAARRYRQKRVDQMSSLESTLKGVQSERDTLKVRVARLEGEVEVLRQLLRSQGDRS